jgi:hypothetical protein
MAPVSEEPASVIPQAPLFAATTGPQLRRAWLNYFYAAARKRTAGRATVTFRHSNICSETPGEHTTQA